MQKHSRIRELAAKLSLGYSTVRRMMINRPGVKRIGKETRREGGRYVRRYYTYLIPDSVVDQLERELLKNGR